VDFAVNITTYRRSDGTTIEKLKKAIDSVFAQNYKKFKIFVIGDSYENPKELFDLCSRYDQKYMYCENLTVKSERDIYKGVKDAVWSYGGTYACNYAVQKSVDLGYEYVCRLDHDDYWSQDHLANIKTCIEETGSLFVCTLSHYLKHGNLIPVKIDGSLGSHLYQSFDLKPGHLVHSSTCINFRKIPLRYVDQYKEKGTVGLPADALMWEYMSAWLKENSETAYVVKRPTCFHLTEGYEKSKRK